MRRGTTPDYILTVAGYDLTACDVYVTLAQFVQEITFTGVRLDISYDSETQASSIVFS